MVCHEEDGVSFLFSLFSCFLFGVSEKPKTLLFLFCSVFAFRWGPVGAGASPRRGDEDGDRWAPETALFFCVLFWCFALFGVLVWRSVSAFACPCYYTDYRRRAPLFYVCFSRVSLLLH